jgi:hypothetical protein
MWRVWLPNQSDLFELAIGWNDRKFDRISSGTSQPLRHFTHFYVEDRFLIYRENEVSGLNPGLGGSGGRLYSAHNEGATLRRLLITIKLVYRNANRSGFRPKR